MMSDARSSRSKASSGSGLSPGRLAQIACLLEVTARKPGNVHRLKDFSDLTFLDFVLSASAIVDPLDRASSEGIGAAVHGAIEATRRVVATNTNLGMVLLLAPMVAVPDGVELKVGLERVLEATTVEDSRAVFPQSGWPNPAAWVTSPTRTWRMNRR